MDAFPVLSQVKSAVQAVCGDLKGARETQINFSRRCPVVSQIRSAVEAAKGDNIAAQQTQKECGMFVLSLVEGTPLVGHAIGTGYYIAGKRERGDEAIKNASRSSAVIAGGVTGFVVGGGPVGATVGGNIAGVAMDGMISGIDSAIHKCFRPFGILSPTKDPKNVGKWVDAVFLIGVDSLTGYAIGRTICLRKANAGYFNEKFVKNPKTIGAATEILRNQRVEVQQMCARNSVHTHQIPNTSNASVARYFTRIFECCEKGIGLTVRFIKSPLGGIVINIVKSEIRNLFNNDDDPIDSQKNLASSKFVGKSCSFGYLSELYELKEEDALNFDYRGLDSINFQETIFNGRKIYFSSQSHSIKRRLSCYF